MSTFRRREDLRQGFAGWWLQPARRGWVAVLFLVLLASNAAGWSLYSGNRDRLIHDERKTCSIQARGLPAGHELAASMRDIHALLTLKPVTPAQKLAAANMSASQIRIVGDLNLHLAAYLAAEAEQPRGRSC